MCIIGLLNSADEIFAPYSRHPIKQRLRLCPFVRSRLQRLDPLKRVCRAQKLHPGPNRPLIDLMQPTENRVRRGRVFSGTCGGLHHVYHWAA